MKLRRLGSGVKHAYERTARGFESAIQLAERRYTPLGRFTPGPFEGWGFLWAPALQGFVALCAILAGASFTDSPFKLEMAHTWFFGVPTAAKATTTNETTLLFSIVLVFGGLVMLMRVWLRLAEVVKQHPGSPAGRIYWILALWCVPMVVAPPLFSRDVFSYAAQGEMTAHHLSPYVLGPFSLGSGAYVNPVDPLWGNTPAPYGPLFLFLDGTLDRLSGHDELVTVVLLRLLEVAAVFLLAWGLSYLARGVHRDPGETMVLGALNPLVLLTLVGGAHNDALMAALLVAGIAFAVHRHPIIGFVLCSSAAAIKAPAALGCVYIAWTWYGPHVDWRRKIRPFVIGGVVGAITLSIYTLLAGFGFGWVRNLATPGTVRSWAAPATGIGLGLTDLAHLFGSHVETSSMITVTRVIGFVAAIAFAAWLLWRADDRGWIRSLGLSLLLFVILGPVVQPWYLVWGIVLMGAVYVGREHFWIVLLSICGPFLGLPGGRQLLSGLVHAGPADMLASVAFLAATLLLPLGRWTQWSWPEVRAPAPAVST